MGQTSQKISNDNFRKDRKLSVNTLDVPVSEFNKVIDDIEELYSTGGGGSGTQLITTHFRIQERGGRLYIDQTITALGFDGVQNTDWEYLTYFVRP